MLKYIKDNIKLFFKGMAIGTAVIIPGVSGGTIAFMLGIYDRMIEAIVDIRRHFKQSFLYLLPILLGALASVLILVFPITWAFDNYPLPLVTLFAGLVIGSLPSITPQLKGKGRPWRIIVAIFAGVVAAGLGVLSVVTSFDASMIVNQLGVLNEFIILLVGIVAVSALIVPGISGSMLLLVIGFYAPITNLIRYLLSIFSSTSSSSVLVPIVVLVVFAIGLAIGFVVISLLMKFLLSKYKAATYFGILGFIIGSLVSLYYNYEVVWMYGFSPWWHYLIAAFLFIGGIAISYTLVRYGNKKDDKEIVS